MKPKPRWSRRTRITSAGMLKRQIIMLASDVGGRDSCRVWRLEENGAMNDKKLAWGQSWVQQSIQRNRRAGNTRLAIRSPTPLTTLKSKRCKSESDKRFKGVPDASGSKQILNQPDISFGKRVNS